MGPVGASISNCDQSSSPVQFDKWGQHFEGIYYPHLYFTPEEGGSIFLETLVPTYQTSEASDLDSRELEQLIRSRHDPETVKCS
jgi:hypothetical protein